MTEATQENQYQPIINITGEKVALGPIRRDLIPLYLKWLNDFEVMRTLAVGLHPMTQEAEEEWYENASVSERSVYFTIYELSTIRPIGNTALSRIDHFHRTAEFGIIIGEKDCWDKGYGTEVTTLMLDYGFTALGLHNMMLQAYAYNERAIRAYTKAGFRMIGRRREAHRLAVEAHDVVFMDCLATEFKSRVLRRILTREENVSDTTKNT